MKIAFDAKRALNNTTGLGNYSRNLINALMAEFPDNDYQLYSPRVKHKFFNQLHGNFNLVLPKTKIYKLLRPLWRSFGVTGQLQQDRVNIYHGLSNELPLNVHRLPIKKVVTIHDLIFLKHTAQYPFFDRQVYKHKTKYAAEHADKIVAVSNETKNDLMKYYGIPESKIEVIYQGVDEQFKNAERRIENAGLIPKYGLPDKYILNVGSFFPRKNHITIVESFALVKDKIEENLVLISSTGGLKKEIEELIVAKNLQNRIKILAQVSNEDMPAIYSGASLFVFPSLYEGFGIPIVEALWSKVPVITTKGGCFEEAGGKNSVYVNPAIKEEIAGAIVKVLGNAILKNEMIESGYAHANTMTGEIAAEKVMRIYEGLNA